MKSTGTMFTSSRLLLRALVPSILVLVSLMSAPDDQAIHVTAEPCHQAPPGGPPPMPASSEQSDPEADPHVAVHPSWLKKPNGKGRKLTSPCWQHIKELTDNCPKQAEGYTHLCTYPTEDGGVCNCYLKLGWNKRIEKWTTSVGVQHSSDAHPDSWAGKEAIARRDVRQQKADGDMDSFGMGLASPGVAGFALSKHDLALTGQANWFIYSPGKVRKIELTAEAFRNMVRAIGDKNTPILGLKSLIYYITGEWNCFLKFLKAALEAGLEKALGNAFVQYLHDGATLANHIKYQGVALQFVDPEWACNHVVAIGLKSCPSGTDKKVAELLQDVVKERLGYDLLTLGNIMVSDRAAKGVAAEAGISETETCLMHDGDKLGMSCTGLLVRTKNKVPVNPFPEGLARLQNGIKAAKHFSYGTDRIRRLHDCCKLTGEACIRPKVIKSATRVAASWRLLNSLLRMPRALAMYKESCANESEPLGWTAPTKLDAEIEAVLKVTQLTSLLAQCERFFNGAYRVVIINLTLSALREKYGRSVQMVDLSQPTTLAILPRKAISCVDMSEVGKECYMRAILEAERRFCSNKTEAINDSPIVMTRRERVATMLDLRTCHGSHLNVEQMAACKEAFYEEYVKFKASAVAVQLAEQLAKEESKAKRTAEESTAGPASKRAKVVDTSFSGVAYGGISTDSESGSEAEPEPELDEQAKLNLYKVEAKRCLKEWRKIEIDWREQYPKHKFNSEDEVDIMDLMPLHIGKLYVKFEAMKLYGHIPIMASSSYGQLGTLNAESFVERMFSCAGGVMDEGNSLLSEDFLEKLTILRMNKKFMGFMRAHRNDIAQQEFKMTVIRTPPRSPPAPSTPGQSTSTAADEDEWETPNSLDALEPRLTEEACCDDWGIDIGGGRGSESD